MVDSSKDAATKTQEAGGSNSVLLIITGPFLRFLSRNEQRKLEDPDKPDKLQELKITFWPFAVAGGLLLGLGVAGGSAFMSGKIDKDAIEAAEKTNPRDGRRGLRRVLAGDKSVPQTAAGEIAAKVAAENISPEHRRAALRTAAASLGLGTVLAFTGAAVCVKFTTWYLEVNTAEEFSDYMRARLPASLQGFNQNIQLKERGQAFNVWFRDTLGVGEWMDKQESLRRERAAVADLEAQYKSSALTPAEAEAEKARIEAHLEGPVARARSLVRRATGL
mmetsp:Transcript_17065/g.27410  ORF Transcript_17065/g.27410 Transcript_17065/m.27410 type:complete len:277 (+) Transcript_17065:165-995(+)|eukprot:CAMPEP_0179436104 /NCGR_PEP_ID=MMETSP0799-20121207/20119_1 /TAXON_ID=46947 /ORGANISM="Geminigera cryophila, Strain CCMP2564" /LENGTH=276 /DNA_ID=CAMNT_0021215951 /DNA_START=165 /DNA_END=995 /DNA_ORIENTATION=+